MDNKEININKEATFDKLFDELITESRITKEFKVTPKLTITLKTLSTSETLNAETVYLASVPNVPYDVIAKARRVSILANATHAVNGVMVLTGDKVRDSEIVKSLHKKYMDLAPTLIDKMFEDYLTLNEEQAKLFEDPVEAIENF